MSASTKEEKKAKQLHTILKIHFILKESIEFFAAALAIDSKHNHNFMLNGIVHEYSTLSPIL